MFLPSQTQNLWSWQRHWPHAPCWTIDLPVPSSGQKRPFCTMPPSGLSASRNLTQTKCVVRICVHVWFRVKWDGTIYKKKILTTPLQNLTSQLHPEEMNKQKLRGCGSKVNNNYPYNEETTITYMISEASFDVRIFLSFLSSTGILSRIKLYLRIACSDMVCKLIYEQRHDWQFLMLLQKGSYQNHLKPLFGSGWRLWGLLPIDRQGTGRTLWFCMFLQKEKHVWQYCE